MGNFFEKLKEKGPGGIPLGVYAAGSVILLYFGYKMFRGKGPASNAASATDSGSAPIDTSQGQPDYYYGSTPPDPNASSPPADTTPPDSTTETAPPAGDSTSALTTAIEKLTQTLTTKKKTKAKKGDKTSHDKKQGHAHTKHKAVHKPKAKNAHAPKKKGKPVTKAGPKRPGIKEMSFQAPGSGYQLAKSAPVKRRPIPIANVPKASPRPPIRKTPARRKAA